MNVSIVGLAGTGGAGMHRDDVIGMVAPVAIDDFRSHLPESVFAGNYPKGLGSPAMGLLCNEMLRRGRRMIIFTLDPLASTEKILEGERLKICVGPYTARPAHNFFATERHYLTRAIVRENPTVLHAHWTYEFALGASRSGLPHLVTAHDAPWNVLRYDFTKYRTIRTIMAYMAGRSAQKIIAVSPYVGEHLRRYGFHSKPIDIIPNGMPASRFTHIHQRDLSTPITFATTLMGWSGRKNGETAIEAFAKVRSQVAGARLLMFGVGHGPQEGAACWARERGWDAGIEFLGYLPQHTDVQKRLLRDVDVLVHPALEEAHPMSLVEAMSLGIPVIGGISSGGVPWTLGMGECGVLVDVRSPDRLAEAMLRLAQNEDDRVRLGMAGQESAKNRFHIEQVASRYEAIYAELARQRR